MFGHRLKCRSVSSQSACAAGNSLSLHCQQQTDPSLRSVESPSQLASNKHSNCKSRIEQLERHLDPADWIADSAGRPSAARRLKRQRGSSNQTPIPSITAPMVSATPLLAIAFFAIYIVVRSVRQYHSLKAFGGHWSTGWSRLWLLKTQSSGQMNKTFTEINRKYGE